MARVPSRLPELLAACLIVVACSGDDGATSGIAATTTMSPSTTGDEPDVLGAVPDEAREAIGAGEPRSSGYWIDWSTCGDDSQAAEAAANGGRAAGWILLDDLLADPGMSLAGHPVTTCEEGIGILADGSDPIRRLARQVLTAELNRNAGSESCAAAAESLPVAHALLSSLGYPDTDVPSSSLEPGDVGTIDRLSELITVYNSGELCR